MKTAKQKFKELRQKYKEYADGAYYFTYEALDYTSKNLVRRAEHATANELLEGCRLYSIEQFGCLAKTILNNMGIRKTEDIGDIVFHLIEFELMGKQEKDKREEFDSVYDFNVAFDLRPIISYNSDRKEWKVQYVQKTRKNSINN